MKKVFIAAAKRTAIGKFMGSLSPLSVASLGAVVAKDIIKSTGIDPAAIDEVIVGTILSAGQKQGVARQVAIQAGIPQEVPAWGLNMICGSGMKTVMTAFQIIKSGEGEVILAGGTESMSNTGYFMPGTLRNGVKMGDFKAVDLMVCDGLTDAFQGIHMGLTAENIAAKYQISRAEQDAFSYGSQQKAISAIDGGKFKDEVVPVEVPDKKNPYIFDTDEFPNRATTPEKLGTLRPAFSKEGTVTAGNASGINDGAAFLLVVSEEALHKHNLTPLAEIVAVGQGGVDPQIMGMGPVPAIRQALKKAGMKLSDVPLIELNEAFAAQSLGVIKELCSEHGVTPEWFSERTNVNGGAIALGHPIGASGNRIIVTLIHEMIRRDQKLGLASLCIGGGMGTAIILKR
ncbi:MAG: acetyl-CoA C-acetyltransferase [Bacteroidetes bacterium]|nr:acetyl-CoA C-acetyltransferase [Bacteroidota bacterium]